MSVGLLTPSQGYKPFRYPWAYDFWQVQQRIHWLPEEVPLGEDVQCWSTILNDKERHLLTQVFRWFTQADIEVQDNYMERYARVFKPTEVKMMLASFANMETIHIDAYSQILETVGMPDSEYQAFMEVDVLREKHDFMAQFNTNSHEDILKTVAIFGAFVEGLQLFATFAILMNFPRFNKMRGMGQIVSWSVRDESLHCDGMIQIYHNLKREVKVDMVAVEAAILGHCLHVVGMEDRFIDLAFEMGGVEGMEASDIKQYIRFIADWRLRQLGMPEYFGVSENPLPWLQALLSGQEHANFFETRSTEYSKASSSGSWLDTWSKFDIK